VLTDVDHREEGDEEEKAEEDAAVLADPVVDWWACRPSEDRRPRTEDRGPRTED